MPRAYQLREVYAKSRVKERPIGKPSALLDLPPQPSGTENIYKIYVASYNNESQLNVIIREAQEIVSNAFGQV